MKKTRDRRLKRVRKTRDRRLEKGDGDERQEIREGRWRREIGD